MGGSTNALPIVSKIFCSSSLTSLMVRKRPHVVHGGGFVVTDCSQNVAFVVDGCGTLGAKGELMLKDGDGEPILFIRRKGGIVQALSTRNKWNGYSMEYEGANKLIFSLTDPKSCLAMKKAIRIRVDPKGHNRDLEFEVNGSFVDKACTIRDCRGNVVAQVEVNELIGSKDFYYVVVQPGYDQAFVVGVIAILDNIHGESTRC
ncbi:protein LURP-one-related 6-like [Phoenix dactylifera]|uniref:Protein LURP-one-related 6-like n=1 Tax=Phoenix dactylifera TaxID=42345 RepID=A0A8B7C6U0_PHODC|nr:protein LURP-one-related 6-like [Phoenix dactylifera]